MTSAMHDDFNPVARVEPGRRRDLPAGRQPAPLEQSLGEDECQESQGHADAGGGEAVTPADPLAQRAANERRQEGTQVDPHVEDRVGPVPPAVALRIKRADHGRDVRLEEPVADDQQAQTEIEQLSLGQGELAQRHQDPADEHRLPLAEVAIRQPAADQGSQVDQAGVDRIDVQRVRSIETDRLRQIKDQEGPHPVEAEPLPHLGGEQDVEPGRVTIQALARRRTRRLSSTRQSET